MTRRLHRLSLKLGGAAGGTAVLLGLAAWLAAGMPLWTVPTGALLLGGIVYVTAHRLLAQRLELAHSMLQQIRRGRFENRETAPVPGGDELNALIWQIYRTGQTLEAELRRLRKVETYRRDFVGIVSHELKTPIFAIQGFSETLLDGALEDEGVRRSFVEKILRNADRMNHLARDLAEIARIETGELQMTVQPFDLGTLYREVNEALELAARNKDVTLRHHLPEDLPPVRGDRGHLRQVLSNLVDNAIKYNNPGGYVKVEAHRRSEQTVEVVVVDDGIGIPEEHVKRLTERFYRVDRSRSRDQGGTGLGLAIVKHILGAHGTRLEIDSIPGRGSTFRFTLPVAGSSVGERERGSMGAFSGTEDGM